MTTTRKRKVKFDFTPSEYQQKFFDWVENGVGNAVLEAYAGAGKTATLVSAMKLIPKDQKCLFIAFNKSIADELNEKIKSLPNANARTMHSLGYAMIRRNLGNKIEIDEYKYRNYIKKHISELTTTEGEIRTQNQIDEYIDSIIMLTNYSRFNLAQTENEINDIATKYDIPVSFDECLVTKKCLEWGKEHYETIDYTDMIWLCIELSLKPIGLQFDWVFLDEAQDTSLMSIQMFLKCINRGGRFVATGDRKQAIYMFAGSSNDAFDFMVNYPNTMLFKLPITYRCGRKIVDLANMFVDNMIPKDDAVEGEILEDVKLSEIKNGDMVLSRTKAPLVKLYSKLLKKGINCYIKGQDIGRKLIDILNSTEEKKLNPTLLNKGVFVELYDKMFTERNKLMEKRGLDFDDATLSTQIMEKYDDINTLLTLSDKCKSKTDLINKIDKIFQEESDGICLSTIHKAKGLESDNVYIICRSAMPSKLAKHKWEKEQELNLMYVAYTRAKNKLAFVSEKEIKPTVSLQEPIAIINELIDTEQIVCKVLGKEPMQRLQNVDLAKFKLQNITKIDEDFDVAKIDKEIKPQPNVENEKLLSELDKLLTN